MPSARSIAISKLSEAASKLTFCSDKNKKINSFGTAIQKLLIFLLLLEIYRNYLKEHGIEEERIISINFEDLDYEELTDYRKLYKYLRELRPLQAIRDHYPKIILTMDEEPEEQYEGIRRINCQRLVIGDCRLSNANSW